MELKNRLEYIVFIAFGIFFRIIGLYLSRRFAVIIAYIFYYLIPIRRDVTINNLKNAFPELDESRIKNIAFGTYKSFAITLAEILLIPSLSREQMINSIKCNNLDIVKNKFNEGKGLILLSAHFGNWEYIAISVALQINNKFTVVVKPLRNNLVSEWMNKARTKWNNEVVSLGVSIRQIYNVLKEKKIAALVADQRGPEESVKLEFFGRKTSVLIGPAVLAIKTGAPIVYGIAVRQKDYSYVADIVEINTKDLPDDYDEKIIEITRRHMKHLESIIRLYPEQWLWMHNRWRH